MKVIDRHKEGLVILLTDEELLIVNNALNEIVNGIDVPEFETRIGSSVNAVKSLLSDIHRILETHRFI